MKRQVTVLTAVAVMFLCAQSAFAFPGQRMPYRVAHFAGSVAYNIDHRVIHPVTHGIARRLR